MTDPDKLLFERMNDEIDAVCERIRSKIHRQPRWSVQDLMRIAGWPNDVSSGSIVSLARFRMMEQGELHFDWDDASWRPGPDPEGIQNGPEY